jgi:hypothetical protein
MKNLICVLLVFALGSFSIKSESIESSKIGIENEIPASPCPNPSDIYNQALFTEYCTSPEGILTGNTYLDCRYQIYSCCNSLDETLCDLPSTEIVVLNF